MVEPKLTLFQIQVEGAGGHAADTNQTRFCMTPKTFNPVDVVTDLGKFVLAVIDPKVLAITNIDQPIEVVPGIRTAC